MVCSSRKANAQFTKQRDPALRAQRNPFANISVAASLCSAAYKIIVNAISRLYIYCQ